MKIQFYRCTCAICLGNIILHSPPEIEISFKFIPIMLMSKNCTNFFGPLFICYDYMESFHRYRFFQGQSSSSLVQFKKSMQLLKRKSELQKNHLLEGDPWKLHFLQHTNCSKRTFIVHVGKSAFASLKIQDFLQYESSCNWK